MEKTSKELSALIGQLNAINEKLREEYPDLERLDPSKWREFKALCERKRQVKQKIQSLEKDLLLKK